MSPTVSIGVPLHNAERYLADALESLAAQDYPNLEFVICDNASTDATWEICHDYARRDDRFRLHRNDRNRGAAYNYNRVVALSTGELFKWAAYDDVCEPSLVSRCVAELERGGAGTVLTYPRTLLIGADGDPRGRFDDRLDLRSPRPAVRVGRLAARVNLCNAVFGVIRRETLLRTGLIRAYPSSDVTLLAELAAYGEFHEVPAPLFHRRIHPDSTRQGRHRDARELAAWFDPARTRRAGASRLAFAVRTAGALATTQLPPATRFGCAANFLLRYGVRRGRATAGRIRRRHLRGD